MSSMTCEHEAKPPSPLLRLVRLLSWRGSDLQLESPASPAAAVDTLAAPRRSKPSDSISIPMHKRVSDTAPCHDRLRRRGVEASSRDVTHLPEWRARQHRCANCMRIFYRAAATAFCSLDCKTSHEYLCALRLSVDVWVDDSLLSV